MLIDIITVQTLCNSNITLKRYSCIVMVQTMCDVDRQVDQNKPCVTLTLHSGGVLTQTECVIGRPALITI